MPRDEENYVALFIDWDNLAISTAVDFAGAVPDVRAIVKAAQRFGTVLLARAYAEWNVSSDRLSVYRAGVEPVYAPTFRFEPEPGTNQPRGKSLADPCLVTDCIDTMHLMPEINVFCLVSGDKDLIPIVRLAQLRGKRVVVIGPDFVAAILRDMADEYIPYRVLAETSDNPPTEISVHGARGQRRVGAGQARAASLPPAQPVQPVRAQTPQRPPPAPVTPVGRPAVAETNGTNGGVAEVASAAVVAEAPTEPVAVEGGLDSGPLFDIVGTIIREREVTGKPRLRATNLKDQLLARIPGFDERKYGYPRFKDLLAAAEKAGVLVVTRTGPVQWVAAPAATAPVVAPTPPPPVEPPAPVPGPVVAEPPPVEEPIAATTAEEEPDTEVVRFILDLRDRSRWLTYTYLLTNLLNHLGKGASDAAADAAARTTLNRLVQSGVLVVDREPREIDVNGTHHRVRLCHLVDTQPLVARLLAQRATAPEAAEAEAEPAPAEEAPAREEAPVVVAEHSRVESARVPEPTIEATPEPTWHAMEWPTAPATSAETAAPATPEPEAVAPVLEPVAVETSPAAFGESQAEVGRAPADEAPIASPVDQAPATEMLAAEPVAEPAASSEPTEAPAETEPVAESDVSHGSNGNNGGSNGASHAPLTLADSYEILREVVRDATGPSRPSTGPAAIKNRLVRRLGSFDERSFGFSKFKDYLQSAERAGAIHLEVVGATARVSLPTE
jgi:hypothetical protein